MADYLRDIREYPVLAQPEPGALIDRLPPHGPETGVPMGEILDDFQKLIVPGLRTGIIRDSLRIFRSPLRDRGFWGKCWQPP